MYDAFSVGLDQRGGTKPNCIGLQEKNQSQNQSQNLKRERRKSQRLNSMTQNGSYAVDDTASS